MKYKELSKIERVLLIGGFVLISPFLIPVLCISAPIVAICYALAYILDCMEL
jgi:hypothetical protein